MRKNRLIIPALLAFLSLQGYAQELNDSITSGKPAKYSDEVVEIGYHKAQRLVILQQGNESHRRHPRTI